MISGESGIRTRETLLAFTRFPGVPLQPLEHLSKTGFLGYTLQIGCKLQRILGIASDLSHKSTFFFHLSLF